MEIVRDAKAWKVKYTQDSHPHWCLSKGLAGKIIGTGDNGILHPGQKQTLVWKPRGGKGWNVRKEKKKRLRL